MNNIDDEQNKEEYLRYRYVSSKLYTYEKVFQKWVIIIGIVFYIIGLVPYLKDNEGLAYLAVGWTLLTFLIDRKKSALHNRAVMYQEYADRQMFGLKLVAGLIEHADTLLADSIAFIEHGNRKREYGERKSIQSKTPLMNWYSSFDGLPIEYARILAQDENITWDMSQRRYYGSVISICIVCIIISTVGTVFMTTKNFMDFILSLPIIKEFLTILIDNNDSIDRANSIKEEIGECYRSIRSREIQGDLSGISDKSQSIQLHIYNNRKESIPVPDIIYQLFRKKLQQSSTNYITALKTELIQAVDYTTEDRLS